VGILGKGTHEVREEAGWIGKLVDPIDEHGELIPGDTGAPGAQRDGFLDPTEIAVRLDPRADVRALASELRKHERLSDTTDASEHNAIPRPGVEAGRCRWLHVSPRTIGNAAL